MFCRLTFHRNNESICCCCCFLVFLWASVRSEDAGHSVQESQEGSGRVGARHGATPQRRPARRAGLHRTRVPRRRPRTARVPAGDDDAAAPFQSAGPAVAAAHRPAPHRHLLRRRAALLERRGREAALLSRCVSSTTPRPASFSASLLAQAEKVLPSMSHWNDPTLVPIDFNRNRKMAASSF